MTFMSTTKRESLGSSKHKDALELPPTSNMAINSFQINAHGLPPTTNNESLDMPLAINSFQIKR